MTNVATEVRRLWPSDWTVLRDTRLRALRDSPHAYASTHSREAGFGERQWRGRFDGATWLVAEDGDAVVGLAGLVEGSDGARYIESVWVAPTHRRRGVFWSLLRRLVVIGRTVRQDTLFLWVMSDNGLAGDVYDRVGFVPTGEEQGIGPPGQRRLERRWRFDVRS